MSTPPEPSSPEVATHAPEAHRTVVSLSWRDRWLTGVAGVAALALVLSLFGLWPRRASHAVPATRFEAALAVERARLPEPATVATPSNRLQLPAFAVRTAPRSGARMFRLALTADRDAFAVWCGSEFVLVDVQLRNGAPVVTRSARFPARGELPGGAAALDLDRDGTSDLVLGVAPAVGVTHRAFSGVFWLRGRVAGGYEPAQPLVETPTIALLAADLDAQPGSELVVLTRGDVAAQRPGELFVFSGGVSPKRAAVLPAVLAPTDLALGEAGPTATDLWVVSAQPGALVRLRLPRDAAGWSAPARSELALRGAQAFVPGPRAGARLFVRDVLGVHAVESDPPRLTPVQAEARVGPAAWLEADRKPALFGASDHGFTWFEGGSGTARERTLPDGVRVVDASSLSASPEARAVLLVSTAEEPARLSLVVLPSVLRGEASEVTLRPGSVETPPGAPHVPLE